MNNNIMLAGGWCCLMFAIFFGVAGTISMKLSETFHNIKPTIAMGFFYLISSIAMTFALKTIDVSIAYATWSGLGTVLVIILGVFLFQESLSHKKLFFLCLIVMGIIGIHLADGFYS